MWTTKSDQTGQMPRLIWDFTGHFVGFVMLQLHYHGYLFLQFACVIWAPSSEFVSSSIPSWQTLTAHAQPSRGARGLAFCLKVPLDSLLVWASSGGSGETAWMRRLAWTFAARIGVSTKFAWRGQFMVIILFVYSYQIFAMIYFCDNFCIAKFAKIYSMQTLKGAHVQ